MKSNKLYLFLALLIMFTNTYSQVYFITDFYCRDTLICYDDNAQNINLNDIDLCLPTGGVYFDTLTENNYIYFGYLFVPNNAGPGKHVVFYTLANDTCQFYITLLEKANAKPIDGNFEPCFGDTVTYTTIPDTSALKYIWWSDELSYSDTTDLPIISINIATNNDFFLKVKILNECGFGDFSDVFIDVKQAVQVNINRIDDTTSGQNNLCMNQLAFYSLPTNYIYTSINWTCQGGRIISKPDSTHIKVQWGENPGPGMLEVSYYENGCNGYASKNINISDAWAPDLPEIWLFGYNMLVCSDSTADSYEWYYASDPTILGTNNFFFADTSKLKGYWVKLCYGDCCNNSDTYGTPMSVNEHPPGYFSVYPNPAQDRLIIRSNLKDISDFEYHIYSQIGLQVFSGRGVSGQALTDISHLSVGLYLIQIRSGLSKFSTVKFIKY